MKADYWDEKKVEKQAPIVQGKKSWLDGIYALIFLIHLPIVFIMFSKCQAQMESLHISEQRIFDGLSKSLAASFTLISTSTLIISLVWMLLSVKWPRQVMHSVFYSLSGLFFLIGVRMLSNFRLFGTVLSFLMSLMTLISYFRWGRHGIANSALISRNAAFSISRKPKIFAIAIPCYIWMICHTSMLLQVLVNLINLMTQSRKGANIFAFCSLLMAYGSLFWSLQVVYCILTVTVSSVIGRSCYSYSGSNMTTPSFLRTIVSASGSICYYSLFALFGYPLGRLFNNIKLKAQFNPYALAHIGIHNKSLGQAGVDTWYLINGPIKAAFEGQIFSNIFLLGTIFGGIFSSSIIYELSSRLGLADPLLVASWSFVIGIISSATIFIMWDMGAKTILLGLADGDERVRARYPQSQRAVEAFCHPSNSV